MIVIVIAVITTIYVRKNAKFLAHLTSHPQADAGQMPQCHLSLLPCSNQTSPRVPQPHFVPTSVSLPPQPLSFSSTSTSSWTTERDTPRFQDDSRPVFSITLPLPPCWQSETHTFSHHISKHLLCLFISMLASHPKLLLKKRTVFCLLVSSAHYSVWCKADINECFGVTACKADADMSSSDFFTSSCLLGA